MTNLLVLKEYVKSFYAKYEEFVVPALKFLLACILFFTINARLGYMERIDSPVIALVAALLCSFMPPGVTVLLCAVFLTLHVYAISLECTVVLLAAFLFVSVVYLRFSPGNYLILLLSPLLFLLKIPFVIPLAAGLFGSLSSAVAVACGAVVYYVLSYVTGNAQVLAAAGQAAETESILQRFKDVIEGVTGNREMVIVAVAFAVTAVLVYGIRRMSISYSRAIAILAGTLLDIVILLVGDLMYDANFSIGTVILGSVVAAFCALVMQFFHFTLDYARTEKVQFEDDEYYYYVKAVPKMAVAAPEKRVKKITSQRAHQNVRRSHNKGKIRK